MKSEVIKRIREDIDAKLDTVVLGSKKSYSKGAILLKGWEHYDSGINDMLMVIISMLQKKFHYDDGENKAGTTKLTSAMTNIGLVMTTTITGFPVTTKSGWKDQVKLGAFIINSLINTGYVTVDRDCPDYDGPILRAPYVIHPTFMWIDIIPEFKKSLTNKYMGIYQEEPQDISGLYDTMSGKPIIKGLTDQVKFNKFMKSDYIKGLNVIRKSGWRVNREVLNTLLNDDIDLSYDEIPKKGSKHRVNKLFKDLQIETRKKDKGKAHKYEDKLFKYEQELKSWILKKDKLNKRSTSTDKQTILERASGLSESDAFYYDVETDYRGRVYNSESYVHYQSSDFSKGILEFSESKKMDANGYKWLLRHIACTYNQSYSIDELKNITWLEEDYVSYLEENSLEDISVDKMSLEDRYLWSQYHCEWLLEVGRSKTIFWDLDKPVMFLAACMDLVGYEDATNNGEDYYSHLPIPVDGSNNGCQHTSAMNRDRNTGSKVGLTNRKIPIDLYVLVAKRLEELTDNFCQSRGMNMKLIRKNISKRACMTRQYSAGSSSISETMFSDCYKNKITEEFDISSEDCDYLADNSVIAIDEICSSNTYIRKFLQKLVEFELGKFGHRFPDGSDATQFISKLKVELSELDRKDKDEHYYERRSEIFEEMKKSSWTLLYGNGSKEISWVTPSGFQVDCALYKQDSVSCKVVIDGKTIEIMGKVDTDKPDYQKHASAIAANMVHSMDATHLVDVAKRWGERGNSSIGAVHDSIAVHACDVNDLLVDIKESFIEIYEDLDIYQYFIDNIITNKDNLKIMKPELGDLDLNEILDSDYFFA